MERREITLSDATQLTSPNPLTLVCTENEDGSTNLATVGFVSYLSFEPPMMSFAMLKSSHTGENARRTKAATIVIPGKGMEQQLFGCGTTSGRDTAKADTFGIELQEIEGSRIKIPANSRVAFVTELKQTVETGDHYLYICEIKTIYGDPSIEAVFAWDGYAELTGAVKA